MRPNLILLIKCTFGQKYIRLWPRINFLYNFVVRHYFIFSLYKLANILSRKFFMAKTYGPSLQTVLYTNILSQKFFMAKTYGPSLCRLYYIIWKHTTITNLIYWSKMENLAKIMFF